MNLKELTKKWWFWLAIIALVLLLLFMPLKACGAIVLDPTGTPTGEVATGYISYFDYFIHGGCPA